MWDYLKNRAAGAFRGTLVTWVEDMRHPDPIGRMMQDMDGGCSVHARDANGISALDRAAALPRPRVVEFLLSRGANPNEAVRGTLRTPLHEAAAQRHYDNAERLLAAGARPSERDHEGATPLHLALESRGDDIAALLIQRGADVHAAMRFGRRPIHIACDKCKAETVGLILDAGADPNCQLESGLTSLAFAAIRETPAFIELLIGRGAKVNAGNERGVGAIDHALSEHRHDNARLLLERGARVDFEEKRHGMSMLHHAIWKSDGAAFDMLMKAGVPLDVCDMKGHSPLHEVIGWLMCNRDTGTQEPTILDHSARCIRVWEAFARRLIQAGASCDARDDNGKTPLDLCEGPFGPEIRTLIEEELSRR